MAIVEMEHLTLVGQQTEMPALIHSLSNEGILEIERDEALEESLAELSKGIHGYRREIPGLDFGQAFRTRMAQLADPEDHSEGLLTSVMTDYPRYISEATRLIEYLDRQVDYCETLVPTNKGLFDKKRKVALEDYQKLGDRQKQILDAADELEKLRLELDDLSRDRTQIEQRYRRFTRWADLPIPGLLRQTKKDPGTEHIALYLGIFRDGVSLEEVEESMAEAGVEAYSYQVLEHRESAISLIFAVHREEVSQAMRVLSTHGFELPPELPPEYEGDFRLAKQAQGDALSSVEELMALKREETKVLARAKPTFEILSDFYRIQRSRIIGMERLLQTPNLFVLTAWCPKAKADDLLAKLEKDYTFAVERRAPLPDENVPTLLENSALASPFEELVMMFSPPRYGIDIDPSGFLVVLYSFFFGIMLSDIGYGLLLMLGTGILVWGLKVQGTIRKMSLVLFSGGIFAIFWGLMFGSFFGNLPTTITGGAINLKPVWFDPLDDPMTLMIASMIFGVIHLFIGMAIKIYMLQRRGNLYEAMTTVFPWYLILGGLGLMLATKIPWAHYVSLAGVAIILILSPSESKNPIKRFFSNLISLYDITSFLGDILSYTRILALTLATAVIALVVNILLELVGITFPAIILGIVVLLFGHILNLALSGLSAYVHAIRLHYVEFFGRFYEGVGRLFAPFDLPTKYTEPKLGVMPMLSGQIPIKSPTVKPQ